MILLSEASIPWSATMRSSYVQIIPRHLLPTNLTLPGGSLAAILPNYWRTCSLTGTKTAQMTIDRLTDPRGMDRSVEAFFHLVMTESISRGRDM